MSNINAELRAARARVAELKAEKEKGEVKEIVEFSSGQRLTLKVSDKGGLSVYGLGRFPTSLYKDQWLALLEIVGNIEEFLEKHDDKFTRKVGKNTDDSEAA